MGDDGAFGLLRVLGAAMARLAEAESTVIRAGSARHLDRPHPRRTHHRAGVSRGRRVHSPHRRTDRRRSPPSSDQRPDLLRGCPPRPVGERGVRRRLRGSVRLHRADADAHARRVVDACSTSSAPLSADVVHADGGRVVKFIGDAVMWVSATPEQLCERPRRSRRPPAGAGSRPAGPGGAGLRHGAGHRRRLLRQRGQPGRPAGGRRRRPGRSSPSPMSATSCPTGPRSAQDPLTLKGFDAPVTTFDMSQGGE